MLETCFCIFFPENFTKISLKGVIREKDAKVRERERGRRELENVYLVLVTVCCLQFVCVSVHVYNLHLLKELSLICFCFNMILVFYSNFMCG